MMAHEQALLGPRPPTPLGTLATSDTDLAAHAGEQIFGVSRYSDEDPDGSRNDLGTMHTFRNKHVIAKCPAILSTSRRAILENFY